MASLRLPAWSAWGYDLLNACNGFVAALATATACIESGAAKRILVVRDGLIISDEAVRK